MIPAKDVGEEFTQKLIAFGHRYYADKKRVPKKPSRRFFHAFWKSLDKKEANDLMKRIFQRFMIEWDKQKDLHAAGGEQ